jgi:prephenate dehydrogenase
MAEKYKDSKISIIGLGLIGGSLARALHERLGISDITAVNRSDKPLNQALEDGCIKRGFVEINEHVFESDIVFVCTPVKAALHYIDLLAGNVKPGCIITDVGSTKGEIIRYVDSLASPPCFIGGHPMTGTEKTGYESGFPHLFENAYYILTPCKSTTKAALEQMTGIIDEIGGIPYVLDAEEHDMITGTISHVPHIIASALVNLVKESDSHDGKMQILAAGGFKDITRIASSSPEMWENIIISNSSHVRAILDKYISMIENFRYNITCDNSKDIYKFFQSAGNFRNSMSSNVRGLLGRTYEIVVDVVDKPGIIGKIATIIGDNNINIKNINVSNSREFEQGCLKITLPDTKSMNLAFDLLYKHGYKVYKTN